MRAGLDLNDFKGQLKNYPRWERGDLNPTFRQLEAISSKTRTPLGYFFLPEPPEDSIPIPDYRTMGEKSVRRPSADLIDIVYDLIRRQDWLRDYRESKGMEPLPFVGSASVEDPPESVAESILSALDLSVDWALKLPKSGDPRRLLKTSAESIGIVVVVNGVVGNNTQRKLDPEEFRGFVLSDRLAPILFVNGSDARSAQIFTLAHELGHIWIDQDGIPDLDQLTLPESKIERFCNEVAAELTVPKSILATIWETRRNSSQPFEELATVFRVSPVVVARRALELSLIDDEHFFSFYDDYRQRYEAALAQSGDDDVPASSGGGDFYANQSYRVGEGFFTAVAEAVKSGELLYRDAYRLTGLKAKTFEQYASRLGYSL